MFAGYTLAPSWSVDNFSDSGPSEISSRSGMVRNSSLDSVPMALQEERRQQHSVSLVEIGLGVVRAEQQTVLEPDQYSLGWVPFLHPPPRPAAPHHLALWVPAPRAPWDNPILDPP